MKNDFGLLFWIHLILIILVWLSPFWLSWKLILFFIFLYYLQLVIFKGCLLTQSQFNIKGREMIFYHYYLTKFGFKIGKEKARIFVDYILPWIILIAAIIIQTRFSIFPLIRILA